MKMFRMMILASAALIAASSMTFAATNALPNGVIAQIQISGGFMPPQLTHSTFFNVDSNGVVTRIDYSVSGSTMKVISKLNNNQLRTIETLARGITPGQLIDVNPMSPEGADFPGHSYRIHNQYGTFVFAERRGNAHTYALHQQSAVVLKNILDRITSAN